MSRFLICFALLGLILAGCSVGRFPGVYQINVEQGNILTQEMVDQLQPGMNRRQVEFILGTPLIKDSLNQNRWDYRYLLRIGNETLEESLVTVFFDGDALIQVQGELVPNWMDGNLSPTKSEEFLDSTTSP